MTAWMVWSLFTSGLIAIGAVAVDRVAANFRLPRRFVWLGAIALSALLPTALAMRPATKADHERMAPGDASAIGPSTATLQPSGQLMPPSIPWTALGRLDRWMAPIWAGASLFLALVLVRRLHALRRLARRCDHEATDFGPVLVSRDVGPAVVGFLRPRIVLPRWVLSEEARTRDLLLRHELEHVRTRDTLLLLLGELAIAAFPWNVGLWWMVRRLALAVEIDCDARVVRATREPHAYGVVLLSVAERRIGTLPLVSSMMAAQTTIEARINAMTTPVRRRRIASSVACAATVALVLSAAACAPRPAPLRVDAPDQNERLARPIRGNRTPRYPERLRAEGVSGHVIVEFAVDARGVPDAASLTVIEATHELFVTAVRNRLPSWRFDGAGIARLPVRFMTSEAWQAEQAGVTSPPGFESYAGLLEPVIVVTAR